MKKAGTKTKYQTGKAPKVKPDKRPVLAEGKDLANQMREFIDKPQEHLVVMYLDARLKLIERRVVSIGTANACMGHPRDVYRPAIELNAIAIALGHNHPSGDPSPSPQDIELTERMRAAGRVLNIGLVDHVVVGKRGWYSIRENEWKDQQSAQTEADMAARAIMAVLVGAAAAGERR